MLTKVNLTNFFCVFQIFWCFPDSFVFKGLYTALLVVDGIAHLVSLVV